MRKQAPTIEWRIAEDEQEWARLCQPLIPATQTQPGLRRWVGELLLLISVLGGIGGWQWYTSQAAWQQSTTELTAAVQQTGSIVNSGWSATARRNPTVAPAIRMLDVQGDQAVVTVMTPAIAQDPAYYQTQFYRRTADGWQRTAPDAALWGAPQHLETASFRWRYQENDAQVVAAVAPQLEAFYTTARHNFGLTNAPRPSKLALEVSVSQSAGYVSSWFGAAEVYVVSSPALYQAPIELTDVELLAQSLALPLLNTVMVQAREHHRLPAAWQPLLNGLRLWQLWELDLPLSIWRNEIVDWLNQDLRSPEHEQSILLPARYAELCAAHVLWLRSPVQINIPLLCTPLDRQPWYFATWGTRVSAMNLNSFRAPTAGTYTEPLALGASQRGQTVMLSTLIEYAVATYGREHLPALVAALPHHQSWETLLPAVYGVSAAEFATGWQEYLARHYGE